jgi:hypothetical protein
MSTEDPKLTGIPPGAEPFEEEERDDAIIGKALWASVGMIVFLAAIIGGVVLWVGRTPPQPVATVTPPQLPAAREVPEVELPSVPFRDVTKAAGIDFIHESGAYGDKLLPETMGGGCAFLDYDSDGDQDILFVNSQRWPWDPRETAGREATLALYANDGAGQYQDMTVDAGLDVSLYGQGCAVGDFDNDRDCDLFISAVTPTAEGQPDAPAGPHRLFRNDGGKFVDITTDSGVAGYPGDWGTSCGWFDYDNDADLDLWVCRYVVWTRDFDLAQDFRLTGGERAYGRPQVFTGMHPLLYRNDGEAKFTDVSGDAGLHIENPATGAPLAKSLGVTFADFDADGRMDVVVANDTVQNLLLHNLGDGRFEELGAVCGVAFDSEGNARGAMGMDVACCRNGEDCHVIAIGNFANEMSAFYVSQPNSMQFTDEAVANGLGPNTRLVLTFGVMFLDADLDGRLDYFQANGHLEDEIAKVQASQTYAQPPQLFWNAGAASKLEFIPMTARELGDEFVRPIVGRGASAADIDADGDLDILIAATGAAPRLLRNDQDLGRHWLRLKLVGNGSTSNRDAIGASAALYAGGERQVRSVMPTRSYLSQTESILTFGLDDATEIERLELIWPDGSRQTLSGLEIDRLHEIRQDE